MICPVCKIDMIVVEYQRVELDFCTECHGIWFDSGELELLFTVAGFSGGGANLLESFHKPSEKIKEKSRKCTICGKKMAKVEMGSSGVLVDKCVRGHGLWFDKGELKQALIEHADSEEAAVDKVLSYLGDAIHDPEDDELST